MKWTIYDPFTGKTIWADPLKRADLVEVVRCKDCKYNQGSACDYSAVWVRPNGFCHLGERKDETDK